MVIALILFLYTACFYGNSEDRVRNGAKKLRKCKEGATQGRLDMFFKPAPSPIAAAKRKVSLPNSEKGPVLKPGVH